MAIDVIYQPEIKAVETIYGGIFTHNELLESVKKTEQMAKEHNTFLLLGNCQAMVASGTVIDTYKLAEYYLNLNLSHKFREAIILPPDKDVADGLRFYETTCINRGFNVKVFESRSAAIAWLTASQ